MLKLLGLGLLFLSCALFGWNQSRGLGKRLELLKEFKRLLLLFSGEIRCGHATLPEAFLRIAKKARTPYQEFFRKAAEELEGDERKPLQEVMESQIVKLQGTGLLEKDLELIVDFGKAIGYLDLAMQLQIVELYGELLDTSIKKAAEEYGPKAKMYRYLGIVGGLFLVILLV